MPEVSTKIPTKLSITIASANEAIRYWLQEVVLQSDVRIEKVTFTQADHFTIELGRTIEG